MDPDGAAKAEIPKKYKSEKTQEDHECNLYGKLEVENAQTYESKT